MEASESGKSKEPPTKTGGAFSEGHSRRLVLQLNVNDVVCGRGVAICKYPGNIQFRELIKTRKVEYNGSSRHKIKKTIADEIYQEIHRRNGRFVRKIDLEDELQKLNIPHGTDAWIIVDDSIAATKIKQALREGIAAKADASVDDPTDSPQKTDPFVDSIPTDPSLTDSVAVVAPAAGLQLGSPLSTPQRALTTTGSNTTVDLNSTSLEINHSKLDCIEFASLPCGSLEQSISSRNLCGYPPQSTSVSAPIRCEKSRTSPSTGDSKQAAIMPPFRGPADYMYREFDNLRSYEEIQTSGQLPTIDASIASLLLRMGSTDDSALETPTAREVAATMKQPRQIADRSFHLDENLRQAALEAIQEQGSTDNEQCDVPDRQPLVLCGHSATHATENPIVGSARIFNTDVARASSSADVSLLEPSSTELRPLCQPPQKDCEPAQSLSVATATTEPPVDLSGEMNEKRSIEAQLLSVEESQTNRSKRMRHAETHYSAIVDLLQSSNQCTKQESSLVPSASPDAFRAFHAFSQRLEFPKVPSHACEPSKSDAPDAGMFLQVNGAAEWLLDSFKRRRDSQPSSAISDDATDSASYERSAPKKHKAT